MPDPRANNESNTVPAENPSDLFPFTLHAQHRRFGDPRDMELYLTFGAPHRLRYVRPSGVVHDEFVDVQYEFTTVEGSAAFQSDLRRRDLVDWFDADVVWSDLTRRTDAYGHIRGLATIQRVKLWRDRHSTCHSLSFYANHPRTWREFALRDFEPGLHVLHRARRRVQMNARRAVGRSRRFSASNIFRPRAASAGQSASGSSTPSSGPDVRYLAIQFSPNAQVQPGSDGGCSSPLLSPTRLPQLTSDHHRLQQILGTVARGPPVGRRIRRALPHEPR